MRIEAQSSLVSLPFRTAPTAPVRDAAPTASRDVERRSADVPGVLRHLADGHYRGVADVRLRIVFHDELAALQAGHEGAEPDPAAPSALPELSEPAGNGAAYAKFLAIYEELRSASATPVADAPAVDAVA